MRRTYFGFGLHGTVVFVQSNPEPSHACTAMIRTWKVLFFFVFSATIVGIKLYFHFTNELSTQPILRHRNDIEIARNTSGKSNNDTIAITALPTSEAEFKTTAHPQVSQTTHTVTNRTSSGVCKWKPTKSTDNLFKYRLIQANCPYLFNKVHHYSTLQKSLAHGVSSQNSKASDGNFIHELMQNCTYTYNDFSNRYYSSDIEKAFPIAFEILIYYKPLNIQQYVRLLRTLYRPQNAYCIHIDRSSPKWWINDVKNFLSCLPNVIVASNSIDVVYATSGILYAHLRCFSELLQSGLKWKYVVSLHGTELPMLTNRQMVMQLKKMNGSNIIMSGSNASKSSEYYSWISREFENNAFGKKVKVPTDFTIFKSAASANSAISRDMVHFMLNDKKSVRLKNFLKKTKTAVEFFFSTVNHFSNAPGGLHTLSKHFRMPLIAQRDWLFGPRYRIRSGFCEGRRVYHNICIVTAYDLPRLLKSSKSSAYWFHNKYFIKYDHIVMDCMDTLLSERNQEEYKHDCTE